MTDDDYRPRRNRRPATPAWVWAVVVMVGFTSAAGVAGLAARWVTLTGGPAGTAQVPPPPTEAPRGPAPAPKKSPPATGPAAKPAAARPQPPKESAVPSGPAKVVRWDEVWELAAKTDDQLRDAEPDATEQAMKKMGGSRKIQAATLSQVYRNYPGDSISPAMIVAVSRLGLPDLERVLARRVGRDCDSNARIGEAAFNYRIERLPKTTVPTEANYLLNVWRVIGLLNIAERAELAGAVSRSPKGDADGFLYDNAARA